jgi:hypothetical protein
MKPQDMDLSRRSLQLEAVDRFNCNSDHRHSLFAMQILNSTTQCRDQVLLLLLLILLLASRNSDRNSRHGFVSSWWLEVVDRFNL